MMAPSSLMTLLALLQAEHAQHQSVPLFADLGDHRMTITTSVPKAQDFFNQGIRLSYGFNHPEAIAAFTEGTRLDPDCALCYWGIAFAYGPNINLPMDSASGAEAHRAAQRAVELAGRVSPREQAYIRALAQRYGTDPSAQSPARDSGYARAMREVADRYPDDLDAQVLHADALMNLSPWTYWVGDRPRPDTPEILRRLESALARNRNHPGACHLFIHAVEAAFPARAVRAARQTVKTLPPPIALMVPLLEGVPAYAHLALVSFGKWQEGIAEPMPAAELKTANGLATYARGVAFAALGRWKDATEALESISQLATQTRAERGEVAPTIVLDIAHHALAGEIALRQRRAGEAVTHFELARDIEDALRAQGRAPEADLVMEQFRRAWQNADVTLTASRF